MAEKLLSTGVMEREEFMNEYFFESYQLFTNSMIFVTAFNQGGIEIEEPTNSRISIKISHHYDICRHVFYFYIKILDMESGEEKWRSTESKIGNHESLIYREFEELTTTAMMNMISEFLVSKTFLERFHYLMTSLTSISISVPKKLPFCH